MKDDRENIGNSIEGVILPKAPKKSDVPWRSNIVLMDKIQHTDERIW